MRLISMLFTFAMILSATLSVLSQDDEPLPASVPMIDEQGYDVTNILLLGSDTSNPNNSGRTDVLLIVSVNRTEGTVALLSLPRDLYVYIPGWRTYRINSAYGHGEQVEAGGGPGLLKETISYNLGLEVDYYARVDFAGFKYLVDAVGGVELTVDCAIQDWQLREPEIDPTIESNWSLFTLPVGLHHMDGDLALWYVRSRRTSNDFDRGRRQQDMLRAIWWRIEDLGLTQQIPEIWGQVSALVDTDLTLPDVIGLLPVAVKLNNIRLTNYRFEQNHHTLSAYTDNGESVQVPVHEQIADLLQEMMTPPTNNQMVTDVIHVEIINATGIADMGRVAADRLAWEGFSVSLVDEVVSRQQYTTIYDYTGQSKGHNRDILQDVLRVADEGVVVQPESAREVDYRVVLGSTYYACTHNVLSPETGED